MPANSKTVKSSKQSEPVAQVVEKKDSKKQATTEVAPAVVAPVVATPAPKQKGGKKVESVAPAVVVAPAEVSPVVQKAGAKKAPAKKVATEVAPVVSTTASEAPAKVVKAKATKAKATPEQKAAGKAKKEAAPKQVKAKKTVEENDDEEGEDEKGVRSFKVQLPGTEDFSGRFTGLTPYQAANKALSKYFRENKNLKTEITFAIRESTRGSKRSTYTYNGKREKLVAPVKYSIKGNDGQTREIVKEYKNKLVKVKKAESKTASA